MILTVEMQLIGEKILYNVFHLVNISFPFFFTCYVTEKIVNGCFARLTFTTSRSSIFTLVNSRI